MNLYDTQAYQYVYAYACHVLTSIGLALPGVVAGHLAVSSLRQSSVVAALGLTIEISILKKCSDKSIHSERLMGNKTVYKQFIVLQTKYAASAELLLHIIV